MADCDLLVLGGGTGGYEAAIRAAELGLKTVIVEEDKLGGTCLHQGCIPSKALLRTAEVWALAKQAGEFGVELEVKGLDYPLAHARKRQIVDQLHKGVEGLVKRAGVTVYHGHGALLPPSIFAPAGAVAVEAKGAETEMISPDKIIIATGSRPRALPGLPFDGARVISSDHALVQETLPSSVAIVGAGAIGCEWASLYADLGVAVTLIELADEVLPLEDEEIARVVNRVLSRRQVKILTAARVLAETYEAGADGISIGVAVGDTKETVSASQLLVAVGRAPVTDGFGLENNQRVKVGTGGIEVDGRCRTADPNIFAIGDVIGHLQLAHVAVLEGLTAVEEIVGLSPDPVDYDRLPRCTYSRPEVASVGLTERAAAEGGRMVSVGKSYFRANGKALISGDSEGLVKVVCDRERGDLLGLHIVGPHATDLLQEGVLARWMEGTVFDLAATTHAHPTLVESIRQAALAAQGDRA